MTRKKPPTKAPPKAPKATKTKPKRRALRCWAGEIEWHPVPRKAKKK